VSAGAAPALGPVGLGWTRPADGQDQAAELPRAEQLCGPRQKIEREQVTAHVPAQLRLRRRLALYAINHDTDVQDVVAVALDQWLRAQNA
jgi:hypothetical protein